MTKFEYLSVLERKLKTLPEAERRDALEYYEGYISDSEDESGAISRLGPPKVAAANILADYVNRASADLRQKKGGSGGIKTALVVTLALFAMPIGLPILITLWPE